MSLIDILFRYSKTFRLIARRQGETTVEVRSPLKHYPLTMNRRRRGLPDAVSTYYIPRCVFEHTLTHLRINGKKRREGYVFWAGGYSMDGDCFVSSCIVPQVPASFGRVKIPPEKMIAISQEVRRHDLLIVAQIHSHPGLTGHSSVDEEKAVGLQPGFISIVVPNFASENRKHLTDCSVYEYVLAGKWHRLTRDEVLAKFVIDEDLLVV